MNKRNMWKIVRNPIDRYSFIDYTGHVVRQDWATESEARAERDKIFALSEAYDAGFPDQKRRDEIFKPIE